MVCVPFCPIIIGAGMYISTPAWLAHRHAVVNVKDYGIKDCFKWVISALFPTTTHANHLSMYRSHKDAIDCTGCNFQSILHRYCYLKAMILLSAFIFYCMTTKVDVSGYFTYCPIFTNVHTKSLDSSDNNKPHKHYV